MQTSKRVLSGLALLCIAALMAAWPSDARKFEWPTLGYPVYICDSLSYSEQTPGAIMDSILAPQGYLMAKLVLRHNVTTSEKLRLGFVETVGTVNDTTEVDQWAYLHDEGNTGDLGDTYYFWPSCEKVYISTATATGQWSYDAYFVDVSSDSAGIYGVTW
jgi:hypothetical protein